jgi:hypothetical protein
MNGWRAGWMDGWIDGWIFVREEQDVRPNLFL